MCWLVSYTVGNIFSYRQCSSCILWSPYHVHAYQPGLQWLVQKALCLCQMADLGLLEPTLPPPRRTVSGNQYPSRGSLELITDEYGGINALDTWLLGQVMLMCVLSHFRSFPMGINYTCPLWQLAFKRAPFIDCPPFPVSPPHSQPVFLYLPK